MAASALRRRVLLSSTMLMAAVVGYGRRADAACVNAGGSTYECSGVNLTTPTINANNATVFTDPGFSVTAAAGNGITITGDGALSYTDVNASPLTAPATALYVRSAGDYLATPGSVTIDTNGVLTGGNFGIYSRNYGTGALTITANGNVTGTSQRGIYAVNSGTYLSVITAAGTTISGGTFGIDARSSGTGALTVTADGDVTGSQGGIFALEAGAADVSVTTSAGTTVSGGVYGVAVRNFGTGALSITANGDVTGTNGVGIYAANSAAGTDLSVTTGGTTSGATYGVFALNYGSGALTVTANGSVTGTAAFGILVYNSAAGTNLNVTTGAGTTVSGGSAGIYAINSGTGALTITVNGDVTGTCACSTGIVAVNSSYGTDLSVTTGAGTTVSGGTYGIRALNYGTGALSITANGDVAGGTNTGIRAYNSAAGGGLSVTTAAGTTVSGGIDGINAHNFGSGALTVTANGNVTGTSGFGIYAYNSSAGTGLSVTTGTGTTVSGYSGIRAGNYGTGALTVTANGNVTGTSSVGIFARNSAAGTTLSVTTGPGAVSGATDGIRALNYGTRALSITANGDVTGTGGFGIYARNLAAGSTDLSVITAAGTTVSGATEGINARLYGTGALNIAANGDVTGTSGRGIYATNSAAGTDLGVTTAAGGTVSGSYGITARNLGTGALTITANGDVTGTTRRGIYAYNSAAGTDLSVTTGAGMTVSGATDGISARLYGTGALTITANGNVTGASGRGIDARNSGAGTSLSVTIGAGATVSGGIGVYARNYGTGALSITAHGDVTGTNNSAIFAYNSAAGGGLSVTTAAGTTVSGGGNNLGIQASNHGSGALAVTTNGVVTGGFTGIGASNFGAGAVTVIANGNVTGNAARGIYAYNSAAGTNLSIITGAGMSGATDGIYARNNGSGALTITANGNVTGTRNDGIRARSAGSPIAVTVGATSSVTSNGATAVAFAVETKGAAATVTVAGTLNGGGGGAIKFDQTGAFANRLELVTGAVVNGNVLGGSGTDTLGLSGTGSGSFNVAQLSSFEAGEKTGSGTWTLTGANTGITAFSVGAGTLAVNGSLSNAAFTVSGGTLMGTGTVGNTSIAGGTFRPGSGTPGTSMNVNGTLGFSAASTYAVDVNPATASFANVSGLATLGGATVNAIFAPGSYVSKQYTILSAGSIAGTFGALTNTNLPANFHDTLSYDATHAYLNLLLNFSTPAPGGLNGNQNNVANALIGFFNTTGGIPMAFGSLNANGLSQASGEAGADVGQAGIDAAGQFTNAIFDAAFDDNGPGGATGFAEEGEQANAYASKSKVADEAGKAFAKAMPVKAISSPSFAARWNVWASAYGGNNRTSGDAVAGTSTTTSRLFGAVAGATYRMTPDTQLGFALGGAGSKFDLAGGFGGGKADIFNAAVYGKHEFGAAYVAGLLGYSWQDTTTDRTVTIAGTDTLHAAFKAQALTARLEGGWRYATPVVGITPYAALQATSFHLPAYGETATSGSNTFALNYAAKTITATRSELGAKFDKAMLVQGGVFTLKAKAAWAHDWNTDRAAIATFQALPGATFTVNGAQPSANAALVSLGGQMGWHNGWTLAGSFDGEFSRTTTSYAGKGSVKYVW